MLDIWSAMEDLRRGSLWGVSVWVSKIRGRRGACSALSLRCCCSSKDNLLMSKGACAGEMGVLELPMELGRCEGDSRVLERSMSLGRDTGESGLIETVSAVVAVSPVAVRSGRGRSAELPSPLSGVLAPGSAMVA